MTRHFIPILLISVLKSQWQETNQPTIWENGTIDIIKAKEDQLYTVTNQAQVYISNDQAYSWEMLADTLETFPSVSYTHLTLPTKRIV